LIGPLAEQHRSLVLDLETLCDDGLQIVMLKCLNTANAAIEQNRNLQNFNLYCG